MNKAIIELAKTLIDAAQKNMEELEYERANRHCQMAIKALQVEFPTVVCDGIDAVIEMLINNPDYKMSDELEEPPQLKK